MAKVTGENLKGEVVYLVLFLYIQDGISVFRLLSIDSRHFFSNFARSRLLHRKAQKDNKKYN